jgi:hypothetical protein
LHSAEPREPVGASTTDNFILPFSLVGPTTRPQILEARRQSINIFQF